MAASGWLALADFLDYQEGLASSQWPATAGKILEHRIKLMHLQGKEVSYKIAVAYLYHVKNQDFRSTRMAFPDNCEVQETDPHRLLDRFGIGKEVQVYYDPGQPAKSTLAKGVENDRYLEKLIRDVLLLAIPIAILFYYLANQLKKKSQSEKSLRAGNEG